MNSFETLVVGAGPAGSSVAYELARRGHEVHVIEEHPKVGSPVQCAGLVSQRVLDLAGTQSMVLRPVHGAAVYSPGFRSISFVAPQPRAFVIDRHRLDVELAERAVRAGSSVETNCRFDGIVGRSSDGIECRVTRGEGDTDTIRARLVIGADGVTSSVARAARLRRPVEILPAYEIEFSDGGEEADRVEVFLGNKFAPGLFGWSIPDGSGGSRVGVAVRAGTVTAREHCDRLVAALRAKLGRRLRSPIGTIVSGIPIGEVPRTVSDGVALVGDAAGQVKPLSGGGIFLGMRCGQLLAESAARGLVASDVSQARLMEYDRAWRAEFWDEIGRALYLRRLLVKLTDEELERIVGALSAAGMAETIVAFGDIDFPTHVARKLLRQSPSLFRLFPKALSALWGSAEPVLPDLDPGLPRTAK